MNISLRGHTLFELLLTLSLISLLFLQATPSFERTICRIRSQTVFNELLHELTLARSLAVSNQKETVYCVINTRQNWHEGRNIIQKGKVLHQFQALPKGYIFSLANSLHKNSSLVFTPLGCTNSECGSFYFETPCTRSKLVISLSGKVRIVNLTNFVKIVLRHSINF